MSENERNPLNAIRKLKELSRNLSQEAQGGRKDGAQKENAGKTTTRRSSARKETGAQETVKKDEAKELYRYI